MTMITIYNNGSEYRLEMSVLCNKSRFGNELDQMLDAIYKQKATGKDKGTITTTDTHIPVCDWKCADTHYGWESPTENFSVSFKMKNDTEWHYYGSVDTTEEMTLALHTLYENEDVGMVEVTRYENRGHDLFEDIIIREDREGNRIPLAPSTLDTVSDCIIELADRTYFLNGCLERLEFDTRHNLEPSPILMEMVGVYLDDINVIKERMDELREDKDCTELIREFISQKKENGQVFFPLHELEKAIGKWDCDMPSITELVTMLDQWNCRIDYLTVNIEGYSDVDMGRR